MGGLRLSREEWLERERRDAEIDYGEELAIARAEDEAARGEAEAEGAARDMVFGRFPDG